MSVLNTSALRRAWDPACKARGDLFLVAYRALDAWLRHHGYEVRAGDTGAYNCRKITGGSGYSLHAFGPGNKFTFWNGPTRTTALAVDINWTTNPYGRTLKTDMPSAMVADIKKVRTLNGKQVWGWGGDYRTNKDAMHFEIVCAPADLATGIDPATLPADKPATQPAKDEPEMNAEERKLLEDTLAEAKAAGLRAAHCEELVAKVIGLHMDESADKGPLLPRIRDGIARLEAK